MDTTRVELRGVVAMVLRGGDDRRRTSEEELVTEEGWSQFADRRHFAACRGSLVQAARERPERSPWSADGWHSCRAFHKVSRA